nr:MAG TPA_asm: hypothetical protein [Caudoviricetes sp.]
MAEFWRNFNKNLCYNCIVYKRDEENKNNFI